MVHDLLPNGKQIIVTNTTITRHSHAYQMRLEQANIRFSPLRRAALAVVQVPTDFNMDSEVL